MKMPFWSFVKLLTLDCGLRSLECGLVLFSLSFFFYLPINSPYTDDNSEIRIQRKTPTLDQPRRLISTDKSKVAGNCVAQLGRLVKLLPRNTTLGENESASPADCHTRESSALLCSCGLDLAGMMVAPRHKHRNGSGHAESRSR